MAKGMILGGRKAAGRVALVDDADFSLVAQYRWHIAERRNSAGLIIGGPYAKTKRPIPPGDKRFRRYSNGRSAQEQVLMHVLIMGHPYIDHIDHDGLNNQRYNLRPTTTAQNNHNQRPQRSTSSRFKGVTWHRQLGKWQACIKINGKTRYLGVFEDEWNAARAYDAGAREAYGAYAYLNEEAP